MIRRSHSKISPSELGAKHVTCNESLNRYYNFYRVVVYLWQDREITSRKRNTSRMVDDMTFVKQVLTEFVNRFSKSELHDMIYLTDQKKESIEKAVDYFDMNAILESDQEGLFNCVCMYWNDILELTALRGYDVSFKFKNDYKHIMREISSYIATTKPKSALRKHLLNLGISADSDDCSIKSIQAFAKALVPEHYFGLNYTKLDAEQVEFSIKLITSGIFDIISVEKATMKAIA